MYKSKIAILLFIALFAFLLTSCEKEASNSSSRESGNMKVSDNLHSEVSVSEESGEPEVVLPEGIPPISDLKYVETNDELGYFRKKVIIYEGEFEGKRCEYTFGEKGDFRGFTVIDEIGEKSTGKGIKTAKQLKEIAEGMKNKYFPSEDYIFVSQDESDGTNSHSFLYHKYYRDIAVHDFLLIILDDSGEILMVSADFRGLFDGAEMPDITKEGIDEELHRQIVEKYKDPEIKYTLDEQVLNRIDEDTFEVVSSFIVHGSGDHDELDAIRIPVS